MSDSIPINSDASASEGAQLLQARLREEKQRIRAEIERIERDLRLQIDKANGHEPRLHKNG